MKSLQQSHKGTKFEADRYNRTDVGSHTTWVSRHMTKVANKHQKCHWQCVNDPEFSISVFVSFFLLFFKLVILYNTVVCFTLLKDS